MSRPSLPSGPDVVVDVDTDPPRPPLDRPLALIGLVLVLGVVLVACSAAPAPPAYVPSVTFQSMAAIPPEARAPFARYLLAVHDRLHPVLAGELARLAPAPPDLLTNVELVLHANTGRIVRAGVVEPSGSPAFDAAVLRAFDRAQPFGAAPSVITSPGGNVYLHWTIHRDPAEGCRPSNARPFRVLRDTIT